MFAGKIDGSEVECSTRVSGFNVAQPPLRNPRALSMGMYSKLPCARAGSGDAEGIKGLENTRKWAQLLREQLFLC